METSSVRFLIQDINLGSTSDNFGLLRRSVCLIPHFLTTERIKDNNVEELVKNAGRKLYFLTQLKRARVTPQDLVAFYCACVRSSLDYACAVFHFSLPQYLQTELERIQKRALFTIYPGLSYAEALVEAGIESIQDHQRQLSINLFCAISENPDNKLNKLVPPIITPNYNLRKTRKFRVPVAKTKRFAESFIMKGAQLA